MLHVQDYFKCQLLKAMMARINVLHALLGSLPGICFVEPLAFATKHLLRIGW